MSRLGIEFIETAYYISEYFPRNDVRYIAINDEYNSEDSNNSQKKIIVNICSVINDRYVKDSSVKRIFTNIAYGKISKEVVVELNNDKVLPL